MADTHADQRLAAILAADVAGYSRLMEADERATVTALDACRAVFQEHVTAHGGRIVDTAGDSVLAVFLSAIGAIEAAIEIQNELGRRNEPLPEGQRMYFRLGVNLGDVIEKDDGSIYGSGVNVAARMESLAEPGGVCISGNVYDFVEGKVDLNFEDIGEQEVKNIARPVHAYRIGIGLAAATSSEEPLPLPDKPSIAVLPFNNMSGDPEQEYFSDGITEDIITGLSYLRGIFVIARNSSFTYKGSAVNVKQVGRDLGVRYVLEGSVRRGGDRVRVTAQLTDAGAGVHVWADRYDGTLEDVFVLQDDITAKVLSALGPEITLAEMQRARGKRSESFDAWDRYLLALQPFYAMDKAGYQGATALLQEAIGVDPRFSTAYATLARCHVHAALHGWGASARKMFTKGEESARKAIALDDQDPFAHVALGWVCIFIREQGRAVNELNRALELSPNLSIAHGYLGVAFSYLGRSDEALAAAERAYRGSPRDPERYIWYVGIANAHFVAEQYEECVRAAEQVVLLQPNFYGGPVGLAMALPYLGRIEEAKKAARRARELSPRLTLKNLADNPLFVREADVARMLEGLRQAGLPE